MEAFQLTVQAHLPAASQVKPQTTAAQSRRTTQLSPVNSQTFEGQMGLVVSSN